MTATTLDETRLEAFGQRLGGVINDGFVALALSVGHRTGLFDTMAALEPSTSDQIAEVAGLQERYVRELLGALTTGGVVSYDATSRTYTLPAEHAALVTRAAGVNNMAALMQMITVSAVVEDDVVRCFREGGGVPYSKYAAFDRVMGEMTRHQVDATLDATLDLDPGLRDRLDQGIDVADVGCGEGYAINVLARSFPKSRFTGYDFTKDVVAAGRAQAKEWGLTNATFERRDVTDLGVVDGLDLITAFDVLHDLAAPDVALASIVAALRPGGVFLCADIAASSRLEENLDHPIGPALYTVSTMRCMTLSLGENGAGLGAAWGEQLALKMLADAGFTSVRTERVEGDMFNVYYVCTRS